MKSPRNQKALLGACGVFVLGFGTVWFILDNGEPQRQAVAKNIKADREPIAPSDSDDAERTGRPVKDPIDKVTNPRPDRITKPQPPPRPGRPRRPRVDNSTPVKKKPMPAA